MGYILYYIISRLILRPCNKMTKNFECTIMETIIYLFVYLYFLIIFFIITIACVSGVRYFQKIPAFNFS